MFGGTVYKRYNYDMAKTRTEVLVTGAYGFLGSYVIDELLNNGYGVTAFGRNKDKMQALKKKYPKIKLAYGDLGNAEDLVKATKGIDAVAHLGALSTVWGKRSDFIDTNVGGTRNVFEACRKNKVSKIVHISSPSIYAGKSDRLDIKEPDYDENNKLNYYIESKILAEKMITSEFNDVNWTILRPRGLFGVGDTSIIPRLIHANSKIGLPLFGGGKNYVDMTCVENVALAVRLALESKKAKHKIYNITNDEPQEFKGLLEELFNALGETPKYRNISLKFALGAASTIEGFYKLFHIYKEPAITRYTICTLGYSQTLDISKAKKDLGYKPKMTLSEGIQKYAKSYKKR